MSRLATIEKLKSLEIKKETIDDLIKNINLYYNVRPIMEVDLRGVNGVDTKKFEVNKVRLIKFLETELYHLDEKIRVLIGEL